jgi:N-methylhydantoinase B
MKYKADAVTMQVIRYAMSQIADEMGYTMVRTSRSTIIKEVMDITCAVFDEKGRTIAQAHHAPMLLTGFEITMAELLRRFSEKNLKDGDIIISNDPYLGGQHVMDVQTFAPVFLGRKIVGWVGSIAHHSDMGGAAPGGVAGGMTEIYMEGIRLPMVKLYRQGKENPDVFAILERNIRVPDKTLGDLRAQASADFVGVRRMKEIFRKYGPAVVRRCTAMLMDYSERRIRTALKGIPNGTYTGGEIIDDDGVRDTPIHLAVNIHKKGDSAVIDFQGTDRQVPGNTNCPFATATAAVFYALIGVLDPHVPPNSGCYRPFKIEAEEGLVVNPRSPAAVAARTNTSQKITEAMLRALSIPCPEKVTAASHGQITTCGFSGYYPGTARRFVYIDIQGGGAGARATKDGRDGQDSHLARFMNTPIEAAELEVPIRIERYELIRDSGGPGRFRGALAPRRDIRMLTDDVSFARYGDRQKFPPPGLFGGLPGSTGKFVLNPGTADEHRCKAKGLDKLKKGDMVALFCPGAGGYGDPLDREPAMVLADVRDGKVSFESAEENYGVVIDRKTLGVDEGGTEALRRKMKDAKKGQRR